MKLRILSLLFFFTCITSSTYAVIDVKENHPTERTQNFQKENFSKKKKIKKRKFRLRNLLQWKKKIKKARKEKKTKLHPLAKWSLIFALIGILAIILSLIGLVPIFGIGVSFESLALVFGIISVIFIQENPEKWHGKKIAWTGIIISALFFILIVLLVAIALILYFSE